MQPENASAAFQETLARAVRQGSADPAAPLDAERLAVYARLVRNNINGFIQRCYPQAARYADSGQWAAAKEAFVAEGSAHSPYFQDIPGEFLAFCRQGCAAFRLSEHILQLMRFEHSQLVAEIAATPPHRFAERKTRLFYLGTLSHSYDVETVCQGVRLLAAAGETVELHICGGGPDLARLQQKFSDGGIIFHGYLPYREMMSLAKGCDIAVNPIHSYAMQSVTNKLSDYMALQKPILNSQQNPEVHRLLNLLPHEHYRSGNGADFAAAYRRLTHNRQAPVQRDEIARRFDRDTAYRRIIAMIEGFV